MAVACLASLDRNSSDISVPPYLSRARIERVGRLMEIHRPAGLCRALRCSCRAGIGPRTGQGVFSRRGPVARAVNCFQSGRGRASATTSQLPVGLVSRFPLYLARGSLWGSTNLSACIWQRNGSLVVDLPRPSMIYGKV